MEENHKKWISGFWRRIFALFIDSLILGAVGFGLGIAFESQFAEMGSWGRAIGFSIALTYFGLMNSVLGNGQTLGKRILNIRVVDSTGSCISVSKAFIRYCIFALPFLFNGAQFTSQAYVSFLLYPLSLIVFGGLFSITYLYLFNRRTRQSLHDLAVGSFVVNVNSPVETTSPIWKGHFIVTTAILVVALILPVIANSFAASFPFKELASTQKELSSIPEVRFASISTGETTVSTIKSGSKTARYISAQVFVDKSLIKDVVFAKNLAEIVSLNFPDYESKNIVQIVLTYGFDIGIWSQWSSYNHSFRPNELGSAAHQIQTSKDR